MGNVESTNTNGPIKHADEHLVVDMPVIIQELQSVQFGVVARGGGEILSFLFPLLSQLLIVLISLHLQFMCHTICMLIPIILIKGFENINVTRADTESFKTLKKLNELSLGVWLLCYGINNFSSLRLYKTLFLQVQNFFP